MSTKGQLITRLAIYALALLSIAAGIPKILQMPQELSFLSSLGATGTAVTILGIVQCAGGILLFLARYRVVGAVLAVLIFLVSSIALLLGGNVPFGLVSFFPIAALCIVVYLDRKRSKTHAA